MMAPVIKQLDRYLTTPPDIMLIPKAYIDVIKLASIYAIKYPSIPNLKISKNIILNIAINKLFNIFPIEYNNNFSFPLKFDKKINDAAYETIYK